MKSQVFKIAHQIKSFFSSFSQALKAAWKIAKIFFGKATIITFAKSSGELRTATAIALGSIKTLTDGYFRFVEQIEGGTQWRSCKLERIILA